MPHPAAGALEGLEQLRVAAMVLVWAVYTSNPQLVGERTVEVAGTVGVPGRISPGTLRSWNMKAKEAMRLKVQGLPEAALLLRLEAL